VPKKKVRPQSDALERPHDFASARVSGAESLAERQPSLPLIRDEEEVDASLAGDRFSAW
jgi:hypothetical protein